jgi:hypothetical protein
MSGIDRSGWALFQTEMGRAFSPFEKTENRVLEAMPQAGMRRALGPRGLGLIGRVRRFPRLKWVGPSALFERTENCVLEGCPRLEWDGPSALAVRVYFLKGQRPATIPAWGNAPGKRSEKIREGPRARSIFAGDYFSISTTNNSSPLNWEYALSIVII